MQITREETPHGLKSPHSSHGVIIPSYNSGAALFSTVRNVLNVWQPVIVVLDGSTDGSETDLYPLVDLNPGLHLLVLPKNLGKGAAVMAALQLALQKGWTHAAVFDADGQHDPHDLPRFMQTSIKHPEAMILGSPIFGNDAPRLRVLGRRVGNTCTHIETLWGGIEDSLFGFRIYPVAQSLHILSRITGGRRFDFDTQLAVRLYWAGIRPLNLTTRVTYPSKESGGISHFRYARDNALLFLVHLQLLLLALLRVPQLFKLRRRPPLIPSAEPT